MLKKLVLSLVVSSAATGAYACSVPNNMESNLREVIERHGGFPVTDEQCAILRKNHLTLNVLGAAIVLSGVNVGWAAVSLQDQKTNIASDNEATSTFVNANDAGSQNVASDAFYAAVGDAIKRLDWNLAAAQVAHYRAIR